MKRIFARLETLSEAEMALLHQSSLRILAEIGVHTPNARMCRILKEQGCLVDEDSQIVRYPAARIEEMLEETRRAADPHAPVELREQQASVSTEVFMIDYLTRTKRPGTMADIRKGCALLDQLDAFPAPDAVVVPADVPSYLSDLCAFHAVYTHQRKPGGTYILNVEAAPAIVEMARAMGREAWFLLDTVSPLKIRKESLDIALTFAEAGMPVSFCSMVTAMGSAPVTAAGAIAMQNAEYLCGMFMLRCLGQKTGGFPGMVHPLDPRTLICSFGSPFIARNSVACAQMARYYGLTPGGNIALTDALAPDFQCGFEKALSMVFGSCAGLRGLGCQGIVGADQGNSFEQFVIDDEWLRMYNSVLKGVEVTEETLGMEAILEAGRNASFLGAEHTMEHLREEVWSSKLFPCESWEAQRAPLLTRAHERVEALTAGWEQRTPVVSPACKETLDRIALEGIMRVERARGRSGDGAEKWILDN